MTNKPTMSAYLQTYRAGPFPGRIDPWAEKGIYFHQIHGGIIGKLVSMLSEPLSTLGYIVGREASIQILDRRIPDLSVRSTNTLSETGDRPIRYATAAKSVQAAPGVMLEWQAPELDALYLRDVQTMNLVTIVEIISPSNKADTHEMDQYIERRTRLVRNRGINVVEIDLIRSARRLIPDAFVETFAYHYAIHLPQEPTHLVGIDFGQPLERLAIPLLNAVYPVEVQTAYTESYVEPMIAAQIQTNGDYTERGLPKPSLLADAQRQAALDAVAAWQTKLATLAEEQS